VEDTRLLPGEEEVELFLGEREVTFRSGASDRLKIHLKEIGSAQR
jgi:hypothetical protein